MILIARWPGVAVVVKFDRSGGLEAYAESSLFALVLLSAVLLPDGGLNAASTAFFIASRTVPHPSMSNIKFASGEPSAVVGLTPIGSGGGEPIGAEGTAPGASEVTADAAAAACVLPLTIPTAFSMPWTSSPVIDGANSESFYESLSIPFPFFCICCSCIPAFFPAMSSIPVDARSFSVPLAPPTTIGLCTPPGRPGPPGTAPAPAIGLNAEALYWNCCCQSAYWWLLYAFKLLLQFTLAFQAASRFRTRQTLRQPFRHFLRREALASRSGILAVALRRRSKTLFIRSFFRLTRRRSTSSSSRG